MSTSSVTNDSKSSAENTSLSSASSTLTIGNTDKRLSNARKIWISDGTVTIVGVWGPGTTMDYNSNWTMPFSEMSLGNMFPKVGDAVQAITQQTMLNTMNTKQVWQYNEPTRFHVELQLYALRDPDVEVMQPLHALELFIAPDVGEFMSGAGRIAKALQVNFGNRIIYQYLILDTMSLPFEKEVDSNGNFVRATVNLTFATSTMVSKNMLKQGYGVKCSLDTSKF